MTKIGKFCKRSEKRKRCGIQELTCIGFSMGRESRLWSLAASTLNFTAP